VTGEPPLGEDDGAPHPRTHAAAQHVVVDGHDTPRCSGQQSGDPADKPGLGAVRVHDVEAAAADHVGQDEHRLEVPHRPQRSDDRHRPYLDARRESGLHDVGVAGTRDLGVEPRFGETGREL
jgi:hypothetical protein